MPNLSCSCGNVIPVPEDSTATRIMCRQCGTAHTMQMMAASEAAAPPPVDAPAAVEAPAELQPPSTKLVALPDVGAAYGGDAPRRSGGGGKKVVAIVVGLLLLGGGGFAGWWFFMRDKGPKAPPDAGGPKAPTKKPVMKIAEKSEPAEVALYNKDLNRVIKGPALKDHKFLEVKLDVDGAALLDEEGKAIVFKPTEFALHDAKAKIVEAKWLYDDARAAFIPDEMVEKRAVTEKPEKVAVRLLFMMPADAGPRLLKFRTELPAPLPK